MRFFKMVSLLAAMAVLPASALTANGRVAHAYRYLETMSQKHAEVFVQVANDPYFRLTFAEAFSAPRWEDYLEREIAAGRDEKQAWTRYNLVFLMEELSLSGVLDVLAAHPALRAHFFAYLAMRANAMANAARAKVPAAEKLLHVLLTSRAFMPLVMAVDRDLPLAAIAGKVDALAEHQFNVSYRQRMLIKDTARALYPHMGGYLMRSNHVIHDRLPPAGVEVLQERGYHDPAMHALIPANLASVFANHHFKPLAIDWQKRKIGDLDLAMAIDLVGEAGILMPDRVNPSLVADPDRHKQHDIMIFLAAELGFGGTNDDARTYLSMVASVLNDPRQPASLFQVAQLKRLGFTLEEIRSLAYDTRDAIIIGDFENREHFVGELTQQLGMSLADLPAALATLHDVVAATGPLTLHLLSKGYQRAEISPHRTADYLHFLIDRRPPPAVTVSPQLGR